MKILKKISAAGKYLVITSLLTTILLIGVEGLSSLVLFLRQLPRTRIVAERIHTEYDPLLGWINRPNLLIRDMYGPGKHFRTNSQRFRNDGDFPVTVPPGSRRWICAGDSFTLGYGVGDDETWCARLAENTPGLKTVNMGQGGYGIDQAYLWVTRDGNRLDYDLLIFAFITADFTRALSPRFRDYPKPLLSVREGKPAVENIPVPRPGFLAERLPRLRAAAGTLKAGQLLRLLARETAGDERPAEETREESAARIQELTGAIFQSLHDRHREDERAVLFVYLPVLEDYRGAANTELMRKFLAAEGEANGWFFLDLVREFRDLKPGQVGELFIGEDIPGYTASAGHYSEKGNQYIAERIRRRISHRPELLPATGNRQPQ